MTHVSCFSVEAEVLDSVISNDIHLIRTAIYWIKETIGTDSFIVCGEKIAGYVSLVGVFATK